MGLSSTSRLAWFCCSEDPSYSSSRLASLRLGQCYFVAAEKRLGVAMSSMNVLAIQCLCISGVDSVGETSQTFSSLFWTCFKSEREILAEIPIGTPALRDPASPDSYPQPPQAVSDALDQWTALEEDSWYFLLSEIALRRITDQVGEMVSKYIDAKVYHHQSPNIEELVPIVAEFERQAEAFREFLPAAIKFPHVPEVTTNEWKQYSRGRYYRVLELMHRPFIFDALHEPDCSATVRALAEKGLANALKYLQHSHRSHRHHGLWLQLRNVVKEASLLLAASTVPAIKMPDGWRAGVTKALETLDYWSWEFPSCKTYASVILTLSESHFANTDEDVPIEFT
ncbi:hypothetical protein S40288_10195 [Stachybotrys chartarum IBT 40288]|nr:hypothetical protein S40288_10195 [Stachybotrys chartarum IBT 40288]